MKNEQKRLEKLLQEHGYIEHLRIIKDPIGIDREVYETNKEIAQTICPKKKT